MTHAGRDRDELVVALDPVLTDSLGAPAERVLRHSHLPVLGRAPAAALPRPIRGTPGAVDIATLELLAGSLPGRAMRLVREWGELHRDELMAAWTHALAHEPLGTIEPLP